LIWDHSNICRDIQKIETLVRKYIPIPQKIYNITKKLRTVDEIEKYFSGFISFIGSTSEQQQIPRQVVREDVMIHTIHAKRKNMSSKINLWLIIMVV